MGTTADKLEYLSGTKDAIKQAIVNKGVAVPDGTTFRGYAEKIGDIIDVPDLSNPGAAGDLRSGKQLVGADGSVISGTMPEVIQATPTISVSSGGLITASAAQSGGIVAAGSKSATQQLPTQAAKTVTPGTTNQTAVASGRYTTGAVTVKGDANLKAENIAEGVSIFGVTGTHSGGAGLSCYSVAFSGAGDGRVAAYLLADGTLQTFYGANTEYQTPAVPRDDVHAAFFIPNVTNSLTTIDGVEVFSHPDIIKAGSNNGAIASPVYLMILTKDITVGTKQGH